MFVLPELDTSGMLPRGVHTATWQELCDRFGGTEKRRALLEGLLRAATSLRDAGVPVLWIGGSFVTSKSEPNDFDGAWDLTKADLRKVDPVLIDQMDLRNGRLKQKLKYGGELLPGSEGNTGMPFQMFLQQTPEGSTRGIVRLNLRTLP